MDATTYELECQSCEAQFNREDVEGGTYECGRCGQSFTRADSADGDSNRCPNCNIFAALASELSCPNCGGSGEDIEEGEFTPPPPPTEEELAQREQARERNRADMERHLEENHQRKLTRAARWTAEGEDRASVFATIRPDMPDELLRDFADLNWGSETYMLSTADAERIACTVMGLILPETPILELDYEERRRRAQERRYPDAFALLGVEHFQRQWDWDSQATGVREDEMARIADALRGL